MLGGATSHMAIAQASLAHSGIYTCAVSDSVSQSLRLHIIDGEKKMEAESLSVPSLFSEIIPSGIRETPPHIISEARLIRHIQECGLGIAIIKRKRDAGKAA